MILPVIAYGHPVLRKKCISISQTYPNLKLLVSNMFETMYAASGVGLAAPQIGLAIRLFIVDATSFSDSSKLSKEDAEACKNFKKVFINPTIVEESGEPWTYNEGCLSIPNIHEDVMRPPKLVIQYLDENFTSQEQMLSGLLARVVQHEYDHIEGILFTDKISAFRRKLLKGKMQKIAKGQIETDYPMTFAKK